MRRKSINSFAGLRFRPRSSMQLTHHLGYPSGGDKPGDTTNHRNGTGSKTVLTEDGPLPIDVPRDREGPFEPRLIAKHERAASAGSTTRLWRCMRAA